ncbi:MAG: peptide chain release factor 3 [Bacillota bacterium]
MDAIKDELKAQIERRRTFAIISHPDAGKTTLTEKLLLYGGAIRLAGSVKARKTNKYATSDWMEIEKQRGISVTSSVMQFPYKGHWINILDTPGHQDFSEDTYRTLTAADSALMLIDAAKGVEPQTIKLFEVCRMQGIPVFTFINKLDRFGKESLALLEEIEEVLGMRSCPMNWPIGMGSDFCGIYDRHSKQIELYRGSNKDTTIPVNGQLMENPRVRDAVDETLLKQLVDDIELLDIAGDPFDYEKIARGTLTPVFFGSAINNFGVQNFLDKFLELAPHPLARKSSTGWVEPAHRAFSGFIFKIQANMNPAHRDRIAFLRICSGKFERGMNVNHVREQKNIRLSQPQQFLAQERNIVETAYPGDIIGLFDPGIFQIGDTLCQEGLFQYERLPQFPPERFAKVSVRDAMKHKQFHKGLRQLAEEGAVQIYNTFMSGIDDIILGVVGELQFDVFQYRLKQEYGADIILHRLPYRFARWINKKKVEPSKINSFDTIFVKDGYDQIVALIENRTALRWLEEKNPEVTFEITNKLSFENV